MEDSLHLVHIIKDGFLLGRGGKEEEAQANAMRTELVKKRKVDKETYGESWTLSTKGREMNALQNYLSDMIDLSKELDANFNCPKIHLMSHWAK